MTNAQIAQKLREIAAAYAIHDEKKYRFQIIAYENAAETLDSLLTEIKDIPSAEKIAGIGTSIRASITQLLTTGTVPHVAEIMKNIPQSVFPLLRVPGIGPKKAYKLTTALKLSDPATVITDVLEKADAKKIEIIEGFGKKSQEDIRDALLAYQKGVQKNIRMSLPVANELAEKLIDYMQTCDAVITISPLGSLRRKKDTIGDIDLAAATNKPDEVIAHFVKCPYTEKIIEQGATSASILITGGRHIDLMTQQPEAFGALLQHFTGSKEHNIKLREHALQNGYSLSEYGIKNVKTGKTLAVDSEEAFYGKLKMDWIPPEIREDEGEIALAVKHSLPRLVELHDIKGDFHLHSNFPIEPSHDMGVSSMEEMIQKAIALKYTIIGFAEHNPSQAKHTPGQVYMLLEKKRKLTDEMNVKYKNSIRLLSLLEIDILPDGTLPIDEQSMKLLDGALVSIHSVFSMDKETMTKRVLQGLSHPKARVLTHPTGRLIPDRRGYELDWDRVFSFAKDHNKAIEINAFPQRLDLPDKLVKQAITKGVKLIINTDSHDVQHMDLMSYGVSVARRGWATKHDILNTLPYNEIEKWFTHQ